MSLSPGFRGRGRGDHGGRLPPGQHLVTDFPVLSAGPTPRTDLAAWSLGVTGDVDTPVSWAWDEFTALPSDRVTVDIHCVTTWSKFDTGWRGVAVDTLLDAAGARGGYLLAECDGGYTTNLPLDDVRGGRAWVAYEYEDAPLAPVHGGPARLLVPHLYFWKSAKWVRTLRVLPDDRRGFWEQLGYHDRGDPWREQRYQGD